MQLFSLCKIQGLELNPKNLESMFEAFVTTKSRAMGLGLAISRLVVEQHGGQLTASSDGKNGALFQFVLPALPLATI